MGEVAVDMSKNMGVGAGGNKKVEAAAAGGRAREEVGLISVAPGSVVCGSVCRASA